MTTWTRLPLVLVGALVLHTAVLPQFRLFGVTADAMLLVAVAAGMAAGAERGAWVGFVAGLLADCFVQTPFGLSALTFTVVAWTVGAFHETVLHPPRWASVLTGLVASGAGVALYALAGAAVGEAHLVSSRLPLVIAVVAGVHALGVPPAVAVLRWALLTERRPALVVGS